MTRAAQRPGVPQRIEVDTAVFELLLVRGLLQARFDQFWIDGTKPEIVLRCHVRA